MGYVLEQAERLYLAVMKMNAFLNKCISGMLDLWAGKVTLSVRLLIQQFKMKCLKCVWFNTVPHV